MNNEHEGQNLIDQMISNSKSNMNNKNNLDEKVSYGLIILFLFFAFFLLFFCKNNVDTSNEVDNQTITDTANV